MPPHLLLHPNTGWTFPEITALCRVFGFAAGGALVDLWVVFVRIYSVGFMIQGLNIISQAVLKLTM